MSEWTLVGAGPSIEALNLRKQKLDGPVVCVNRAFYRFPREADVWACFDQPEAMIEEMGREDTLGLMQRRANLTGQGGGGRPAPTVWCRRKDREVWWRLEPPARWGVESRRFEVHEGDQRHARSKKGRGGEPLLPGVPWQSETMVDWGVGSLLLALHLILREGMGATRVRILGCDQAGVGGWMNRGKTWPPRGRQDQNAGWWERRWEHEREHLARAIDEAAEHGIEVEHVKAEVPA
jgi:hypothetical protein